MTSLDQGPHLYASNSNEDKPACNDCGTTIFFTGKLEDPDGGFVCGSCAAGRLLLGGNKKTVN
jgi:hypothetical protein